LFVSDFFQKTFFSLKNLLFSFLSICLGFLKKSLYQKKKNPYLKMKNYYDYLFSKSFFKNKEATDVQVKTHFFQKKWIFVDSRETKITLDFFKNI